MQNYGMRLILSKPPRTPSEQLREELGWKTLEERWSRSRLKLVLPRPTTDFFIKSFSFRGAQDWNTLPSYIRMINTITTF